MIAAFQVFFVKGVFLNMGGYVPHSDQTESALIYIEISFICVQLVICVLSSITIVFYKLDDKREEMDNELERRREMINNIQSRML
jgi:GPH family glycoside/pentoside/hexuronide:cation symporter